MVPLNLPSQYGSMKEYVDDILSRLDRNDISLTKLHIIDISYPMVDLDGGDNLDTDTLVELLSKGSKTPHIQCLELRFVELDHGEAISQAFQNLLVDLRRQWDSVAVTGCSGMTSCTSDNRAIASALDRCLTLDCHQNQTLASALGTLGISLATSASLQVLELTRWDLRGDLRGDHARALLDGLGSNTHLIRLVMSFCDFDDDGVDALAEIFRQNSWLQELELGGCHLHDSQTERVVLALNGHPKLQYLGLSINGCHMRGAQAIGQLLQDPQCHLASLNLSHQKATSLPGSVICIEPIAKALLMNTSLKKLRLSRNHLTIQEVQCLISSLTVNQTLQFLDLDSNDLGDAGALMIAATLWKLRGLRELYLRGNDIRLSETFIAFWTSLQTSNRTLHILELTFWTSLRPCEHQAQIRYELALNAAGRCLLLNKRVPLGLWPHVIERVLKKQYFSRYLHEFSSKHSLRWDCLYRLLQGPALLSMR